MFLQSDAAWSCIPVGQQRFFFQIKIHEKTISCPPLFDTACAPGRPFSQVIRAIMVSGARQCCWSQFKGPEILFSQLASYYKYLVLYEHPCLDVSVL